MCGAAPGGEVARAQAGSCPEAARLSTSDAAGFEGKCVHLAVRMAWLEPTLGAGPYFAGERFSLVDAAFGPVFRYFNTFKAALPPLGVFDGVPKVRA